MQALTENIDKKTGVFGVIQPLGELAAEFGLGGKNNG